ncbi:MAG: thiamine diphosphokinase [Acidimicrobiia bacterium]|nr:thiamine diphosphokinase [Acidimicrobiia bacterium]
MSFAVILGGGALPERRLLAGIEHADVIIAADGGVRIARSHGLAIHVLLGDLDSASEGDVAWARAENAEIIEFSADKDHTDLELALDHADETNVDRIVAIGVDGGRLDHELGNWGALCAERKARVDVYTAQGMASVLHGGRHGSLTLAGAVGDVVSLVPRSDEVRGVTTSGLRWPLENAVLASTSTRGISNEFAHVEASVELDAGTLIVVRPRVGALDTGGDASL